MTSLPYFSEKIDMDQILWRPSSRSFGESECVEVGKTPTGVVGIRDSKDRTGPVLWFRGNAFGQFVEAIKRGEFDREIGLGE